MVWHDNSELMDQILNRMERPLREVFIAHELQQMTVAEVSEAFSLPVRTAHARVRAARYEFEALVEMHRAEQRRRGALVLPITAAMLIASERDRAVRFAEELSARMLNRLERIAEEETSADRPQPKSDPRPGDGSQAPPEPRPGGMGASPEPRPGGMGASPEPRPPIAVRRGLTGLDMYMKRIGDAEARRMSMVAGAGILLAGALLGGAVVLSFVPITVRGPSLLRAGIAASAEANFWKYLLPPAEAEPSASAAPSSCEAAPEAPQR